jgi:hypothetical protein
MRRTILTLTVLALASLAARPVHASAKDIMPGGIGAYFAPTFILAGRWHDDARFDTGDTETYDQDWRFQAFTPALGIFGEYQLHPHVALGLEGYLAFTKVKKYKDTNLSDPMWMRCETCGSDVVFSLMVRVKAPFGLGPWVGIYPLGGFGFDLYAANRKESLGGVDARFAGIAAMLGFGTEIYNLPIVTPFAEVRYHFNIGWDTLEQTGLTEDVRAATHSLLFVVGARFL